MSRRASLMCACDGNSQYCCTKEFEGSLKIAWNRCFSSCTSINSIRSLFQWAKEIHFSKMGKERFLAPDVVVVLLLVVVVVVPRPKSVLSSLSLRKPGQNDVM